MNDAVHVRRCQDSTGRCTLLHSQVRTNQHSTQVHLFFQMFVPLLAAFLVFPFFILSLSFFCLSFVPHIYCFLVSYFLACNSCWFLFCVLYPFCFLLFFFSLSCVLCFSYHSPVLCALIQLFLFLSASVTALAGVWHTCTSVSVGGRLTDLCLISSASVDRSHTSLT